MAPSPEKKREHAGKSYLGIQFNCCNVYQRIYKNRHATAYEGRCPKCGSYVRVPIGEGGSSQRFFSTT
ncbi:MAG: hypothetical protein GF398_13570 [Chitinivibrionales bacterium]|nr:hypothetical protein [Chitinivibrionales bacterium]